MTGNPPKKITFPLPSQIADVPGTEGWQDMYAYFTRFRPEDDQRFWFYNSMHFPEPMPAFDAITTEIPYIAMGANTTRMFAFPAALGIDYRIINGRVYITANAVSDPAEIEKRAKVFQERASYYYENWTRLNEEWRKRMLKLIEDLEAVKIPELPEFEDEAVIREARGIAQNHYLRESFHRCIDSLSVMWQHHFEFLMLGYGAYLVFFQFCKKAFPEISDQTVARMVAGIDVLMFRPDDEIKRLARLAVELGVDGHFAEGRDPNEILEAMRASGEAGEKWLAELEKSRQPWFNVTPGDGFYHHHRSWNDDLTLPFSALYSYIGQIKAGKSLDRPIEELRRERARIIAEYRELLTTEEDRKAFDQMLELCHLVFPYVENHKFYCEQWHTTVFFNKIREFGRLLARQGLIDDPEDIFHLRHTEVEDALTDVALGWASGTGPVGKNHWKPIVARRKEIIEKLREWNAPPALGPMPERIEDPAVQMLWGITSETLQEWARTPGEVNENELHGYAASPGVVEGIARVLKNVNEFGEVREGDILVCPVTAPSWAPLFNKIKAAVSDIGGAMSHAAIVAREYGMPAVVGTGQATKRIRSGQRIRVDGNRGVVTILE
ncbi:MAG: PEP-utilizing enzyme [Pseudomonadota bacterium]|jgi:Phosphoenolpyruvate synthase/pyruvate phosphate dikinase|nr:MAG: PEP-utilizing protein mobile subunit [Pseudomonadota bacterium]